MAGDLDTARSWHILDSKKVSKADWHLESDCLQAFKLKCAGQLQWAWQWQLTSNSTALKRASALASRPGPV